MYMFISLSAVFLQCQMETIFFADKCVDIIHLNGADNLVVKKIEQV